MDLPPLPQRSSSPAPLPSSSKTFPAPPLLPQEAQFMCLDDDTFVGRKESCPLPLLQREEEKMLAAIYRGGGGGGGERNYPSLCQPCLSLRPLASTNDKKFIRLVGGKKHHLEARRRRCRSEREGKGTFGSGVASLCIASYSSTVYSHRLSRKKGEKQHNCESMALHHCT